MSRVQSVQSTIAKRGLVMVITGNGKGKTTSAFGQALRAIGHGYKVCVIQFMKGRKYGEIMAVEKYIPDITIIQSGLDSFVMKDNPAPIDIDLAKQGFKKAQEIVKSKKYDLVILDEINVAVNFNLISEQEVIDLIKQKPLEVNLLLTGRYASDKIEEAADMVSDIAEVKHHYNAGIKGQAGIEY
ncbi:cob(I)yrinic acid a,c-diamide adenosyltransferase [Clostridium sp. WLY-B-L2]|jgi:cob(I)alamin adenosyltransferase|uniref:Cob(I)yrinic acid a,c-diamide adenosyltransferase n=1 Tax=Clostridium aromativorans TaxID=2836848 RepID=A0ABS8N7Y9_9CLOT|nr:MULTISPECIES: cob(I)yrinic acid a,c-diamide adenosyltransferase [Clostridium]KAA8680563.1 cob(I)yrinic acid a,c-diamide adenosyltransferase [Clostridium sp. HV4-5-A1G]MCC9295289.1 cob(I)yrinic acid a,c-diamide adenosyltransferase [Clostridium aromativorans]CAB1261782.1 Cob(I)alamin adenosyltransferase [Clostridiaceae bacterium BL-3]